MVGNQDRWKEDIFVACPLRDLIPDDYILKQVDRVLDLSWLRDEIRDCYCHNNGRASIDPEAALRLMLAGFFLGIVKDRKLLREAQMHIGIRWFAGWRLHEKLPHHSSLTRIRQRWGEQRFKRIFQRTVSACVEAGLVNAETVHVDATLIRADVSWESLSTEHAEQVVKENAGTEESGGESNEKPRRKPGRPRKKAPKKKKRSRTDPEATMTTSSRKKRLEPCYKQHTAVDDKTGVVVDVAVTTGEENEGKQLLEQIERIEGNTGQTVETVTADRGYAHAGNYAALEESGRVAVIPPQVRKTAGKLPLQRFKYDSRKQVVRCPGGKYLRRSYEGKKGWTYRARMCDCRDCPLRSRCVPPTAKVRTVLIVEGYEALLRARRRKAKGWNPAWKESYERHKWWVEGRHGEAKVLHGLGRAIRRGRVNVAIQVYLTAAVINLKRLATAPAGKSLPKPAVAVLTRLFTDFCRLFGFDPVAIYATVS